jgi:hypothetical protein
MVSEDKGHGDRMQRILSEISSDGVTLNQGRLMMPSNRSRLSFSRFRVLHVRVCVCVCVCVCVQVYVFVSVCVRM